MSNKNYDGFGHGNQPVCINKTITMIWFVDKRTSKCDQVRSLVPCLHGMDLNTGLLQLICKNLILQTTCPSLQNNPSSLQNKI